ncbi:hypothetical protein NP493_691g02048 [Ridgeia piscesae]|uniref:Uncharacterized protein n=1 Tax=Ridgeia piscesae TaxID=27915 RepID=A0AAD9NMQ8_RIDPI|nr:hypothetical protein NP493_691g02048 [Ridgeia piscesae]
MMCVYIIPSGDGGSKSMSVGGSWPGGRQRQRVDQEQDRLRLSVSARRLRVAGRSHPAAAANPFRSTSGDNSASIRLASIRCERRTCFDVVCKLTVAWRDH